MNRVLLTGRLTRDPEMRSLSSGKAVTQFSIATNEYIGQGKERAEYHNIVTWDRLAQTCGEFLGKGQQVAIEGRIQTRSWDDDAGKRHWRTEIVANHVEMLSGRRKNESYRLIRSDPAPGLCREAARGARPAVAADVNATTSVGYVCRGSAPVAAAHRRERRSIVRSVVRTSAASTRPRNGSALFGTASSAAA